MSGHLEWNPLKYGDALGLTHGPLSGRAPGKLTDKALDIQEKLNPFISRGKLESANDIAPYIAGAIFGGMALGGGSLFGGAGAGAAEGGGALAGGGATAFPVGGAGGPEIAGFATGGDPFVSATGGGLLGSPAAGPAAGSGMGWQQYARLGNMGQSLMNNSGPQNASMQHTGPRLLPAQYYMPEFTPVYPGVLSPFIQGR